MEELSQEQDFEDTYESILTTPELKPDKKQNIKTIIFDLGGVYFTEGSHLAIEKIKKKCKITNCELLEHAFSNNPGAEARLIRLGIISIDEFEERVADKINMPKSEMHHIRHLWFSSYIPNYKMEDIIKYLSESGNYRLIIFSGNVKERIEYLNDKYDFLRYFNDVMFSYDYNLNKRDINFYYELVNHIGCAPSEALLIDDNHYVINRAKSLGINCIQYSYTEQFIEDLKKFNININLDL